jgi:hypothetical protein
MGVVSSFALLISDRVYYKGLLQKPSKSDNEDHIDILSSPAVRMNDERNLASQNSDLRNYKDNQGLRHKVKRSIARSSMAR